MANWYAVYTRPRCEKKVAEGFLKRKWQSYCPLNKVGRSWPGLMTPSVALFPCYVFVRLEQVQLPEVKKVDGVINLVYWLGKPVIVLDGDMEMIQRFLSMNKAVQIEKMAVDSNARIKLIQSPVVQKQERMVAVGAAGDKLLLPSLGWLLTAIQPAYHSILTNQRTSKQDSLLKTG